MLPLIDSPALPPVVRGLLNGTVFVISLFLLERSADVFVDSTAVVAKRLGIPTILVGLLTAGAEWEELAVVVSSLINGNPSLALSNIYGSSIANILGSFSLGLLFSPSSLTGTEQSSAKIYTSLLLLLSVFIVLLGTPWARKHIGPQAQNGMVKGRIVGGMLVGVFVLYVAGIAWGIYKGAVVPPEDSDSDSDSDSSESDDGSGFTSDDERRVPATEITGLLVPPRPTPTRKPATTTHTHLLHLLLSTLLLSLSGFLLSSTTSSLATLLSLSSSTLGLTLLSLATTLPEKLVAVKAGMKKQSGVLVANTVGSNVFLGSLVLGVVYLVEGGATYGKGREGQGGREGGEEAVDVAVMLGSAGLLALIVWVGKFRRWMGVGLLVGYVGYIASVLLRETRWKL